MKPTKKQAVVIGAGPAGLTAAHELLQTKQFTVSVLEKEKVVGGLARTTEFKNCYFDVGPHHFLTDSPKILQWWRRIMGADFAEHKRFTRIFYKKHYFNYPLEPLNVIRGLSILECARSIGSYLWIRLFPIKEVRSFEDWVTNKFGRRLFAHFFKTYTEKVWGIECHRISADWSAQRIKGFSLSQAIFYAFFGRWCTKNKPRTLSDAFYYPSRGSGVMWNNVAEHVAADESGTIALDTDVIGIEHENDRILAIATKTTTAKKMRGASAAITYYDVDYCLSSMPLRALVLALEPAAPPLVIAAAKALRYRGLITVNLIVNRPHICPDHWMYIHEKEVRVGRIGNMNNFSPFMVDDPAKHTALSLEYFSFTDEPFWFKSDYELVEIAKRELEKMGIVQSPAVIDGMVLRVPEAYPVYDEHYKEHLGTVLQYLDRFANLKLMGRNGLHQYNNMDIAMLSAMKAVDAVLTMENQQQVWREAADDLVL
jgi:protoporphyrinogen oxidase